MRLRRRRWNLDWTKYLACSTHHAVIVAKTIQWEQFQCRSMNSWVYGLELLACGCWLRLCGISYFLFLRVSGCRWEGNLSGNKTLMSASVSSSLRQSFLAVPTVLLRLLSIIGENSTQNENSPGGPSGRFLDFSVLKSFPEITQIKRRLMSRHWCQEFERRKKLGRCLKRRECNQRILLEFGYSSLSGLGAN